MQGSWCIGSHIKLSLAFVKAYQQSEAPCNIDEGHLPSRIGMHADPTLAGDLATIANNLAIADCGVAMEVSSCKKGIYITKLVEIWIYIKNGYAYRSL